MHKKKILFIHHSAEIGGAGISGLYLLDVLKNAGYEIVVYCKTVKGNIADMYIQNGYKVIKAGSSPVQFKHCVGSELFFFSIRSIKNIIDIIRDKKNIVTTISKVQPDTVIVNSMTLFWIGKIAKRFNLETICFFRETYVKGMTGLRNMFIKRNLNNYFDKISFISNYELNQNKNIKSIKRTIYNMVEVRKNNKYSKEEIKKKYGFEESDFLILYIGGLSKLKGANVVLKALKKINDEKIKLVFVDDKKEIEVKKWNQCFSIVEKFRYILNLDFTNWCMRFIIKNNLKSRIILLPKINNLTSLFKACDILVCPMTKPHQSRPLFEAGYFKVPVAITDFENTREFTNNENCYLFENGDYNRLSEIIKSIHLNRDEAKKKIIRNYQTTMKYHSPVLFKKRVLEIIES